MTLQKWIEDRAIHGFPTFSVEDVRAADLCSSEQILQNGLSRLCSNKTIASVYRGYYVIIPTQYVLRGSVPATYYIDQLMSYLQKPYYVCMLSAAELLGAAHQRPQQFSVMTTFPKRRTVSTRNVTIDWYYRDGLPEEAARPHHSLLASIAAMTKASPGRVSMTTRISLAVLAMPRLSAAT